MSSQQIKNFIAYLFCIVTVVALFVSNFIPTEQGLKYLYGTDIVFALLFLFYVFNRLKNNSYLQEDFIKKYPWAKYKILLYPFMFICPLLLFSLPLNWGMPWLYNAAFGKEGYVFAVVTRWDGGGARWCAHPEVNHLGIFDQAPRALCVKGENTTTYKVGTQVKLIGKMSKIGINASSIEIANGP